MLCNNTYNLLYTRIVGETHLFVGGENSVENDRLGNENSIVNKA